MGFNDNSLNGNLDRAEHQADARSDLVFSKRFTEVDQFAEFLPYRQYQMVQLSCGSFQSEFLGVRVGNLYFTRVSAYPSVQTVGPKQGGSSHLAFALVWVAQEGNFCSHGRPLNFQTDLYGFDMQREAHLVIPPGGIMTNMFVPTKLFQACASQLQRCDLDDRFFATNHATLLPDRMGQIKAYLQEIFWLAQHNPDWLQQPHVSELVANDFVPLLVRSIPTNGKKPALKPFRRASLVARAEQEMVDCLEEPLTLKELAQRLESSSSALSYGFQDLFGMSPMRYLKVRRLNAVRRLLKARDPQQTSVIALAGRFGFWNTGHFARDYKAMFGELPSETLAATFSPDPGFKYIQADPEGKISKSNLFISK